MRINKGFLLIAVTAAVMALIGCASVMNPYESKFNCPETDKGKCIPISAAYDESVNGKKKNGNLFEQGEAGKPPSEGWVEPTPYGKDMYQEALYEELSGLIKDPRTPMVRPPKVLRVLLLPYTGEGNELYMKRFVYLIVDGPEWILKDITDWEE